MSVEDDAFQPPGFLRAARQQQQQRAGYFGASLGDQRSTMTLVVGVRSSSRLDFFSDTMIRDPKAGRDDRMPGRLKVLALRPGLCVGYAGLAVQAIDVIRELEKRLGSTIDRTAVLEHLHRAHLDLGKGASFLIGFGGQDRQLRKVAYGMVSEDLQEAWIGDASAISMFRRKRDAAFGQLQAELDHLAPLCRGHSAMSELVSGGSVDNVSGFSVSVMETKHGFTYLQGLTHHIAPVTMNLKPKTWTKVPLGGIPEGAMRCVYLVPDTPGVPVFGVYIPGARLAWIYAPLVHDDATRHSEVEVDDVVARVFDEHGITLTGFGY